MKILGKIAVLIIFLHVSLMASVSATVDATEVTRGDSVNLELKVSGSNIKAPQISELCGVRVDSTSRTESSSYINGSYSSNTVFSYMFTPTKSCTITPISVEVNGAVQKSEPIDIKVSKMKVTKNSDYILELHVDKEHLYVGEPFSLTMLFKQKRSARGVDSQFSPPKMDNFWVKKENEGKKYVDGDYIVTKVEWVLSPQKAGDLSIEPAIIKIAHRVASRDPWGQFMPRMKWRTYISNGVTLHVKNAPADLVGQFNISMGYDKTTTEANEPVNVTIKITGEGNFEDIGSLKPVIAGASVYAEEPTINQFVDGGKLVGTYVQKMAIVADRNFTIPSIELKFFNPKTKEIEVKRSNPIAIEVKNSGVSMPSKTLHVERASDDVTSSAQVKEVAKPITYVTMALLLSAGIAIGVIFTLLLQRIRFSKKEKSVHINVKDKKAVLNFLMLHMDDEASREMVNRLDRVLYSGEKENIDPKELKALIIRLQSK